MIEHPQPPIAALLVTFCPDGVRLGALLDALMPQVAAVVVLHNGGNEGELAAAIADRQVALLRQPGNVGLAAAQNAGIAWARIQGYSHVLMLDQDSLPAPDMVTRLMHALASSGRAAAAGPCFVDARDGHSAPFVQIGFPINHKLRCNQAGGTITADFLIGSGMLIQLAAIDTVGNMDAGLFIDNVDLEWSFRARAAGYELLGVCNARMQHRLGDARRHLPGMPRGVVVHSPLRLYYMMRNRVLLYRLPHVPRLWVAQDVPRVLVKLFLFGALIGPRRRNLRCMVRGLWDGARGRKGPAPLLVEARGDAR